MARFKMFLIPLLLVIIVIVSCELINSKIRISTLIKLIDVEKEKIAYVENRNKYWKNEAFRAVKEIGRLKNTTDNYGQAICIEKENKIVVDNPILAGQEGCEIYGHRPVLISIENGYDSENGFVKDDRHRIYRAKCAICGKIESCGFNVKPID